MHIAAAFNSLNLARRLESAGFPIKQAQDMAAAHAEAAAEWQGNLDLANKSDLQNLEVSAKTELHKLEADLRRVEGALRQDIQRLETRIVEKANDTIKWIIGAMIAIASVVITLVQLHH